MRTLTRAAASGMCSLLLLTSGVAWADFTPIQLPDAQYVAETTLLNITDPDFSTIPSLSDGVETVSFDIDLVVLTVPATWGTWGAPPNTETTTPTVLWTGGFTTLTMTLSAPAFVFGFEAQPNALFPADISVNFFDGAMLVGAISLDVDGLGGARLFAASTTLTPFTRVEISSPGDFAIGQLRYALNAVPEPDTLALALLGLALVVFHRRRAAVR